MLTERKSTLGKLKGKVVIQARPTGRKRVHHRSFCTEVAHGTTFSGAEVEAVLRLAAENSKTARGERRHSRFWRYWNANTIVQK